MNLVSVTVYVQPDGSVPASPVVLGLNAEYILKVDPYTNASVGSVVTKIKYKNQDNSQVLIQDYQVSNTVASIIAASGTGTGVANSGQATLVAGTLAITIPGLTISNKGYVSLVASATGSSTVTYQGVCTANTLTLRANVAAGTINVADISTLNWFVI